MKQGAARTGKPLPGAPFATVNSLGKGSWGRSASRRLSKQRDNGGNKEPGKEKENAADGPAALRAQNLTGLF